MVYLSIAFNFIVKILTFKKGALLLLSASLSCIVTYILSITTATTDSHINTSIVQTILKGVDLRDVILTATVEIMFFTFFMLFTTVDLITGIQNALYFNSIEKEPLPLKEVIESNKLWRTFWKSFGVSVLTLMLTGLAIFMLLVKSYTPYWFMLWSLVCFWLMACGFEFYSIGENLAKRNNGNKPPIFGFVDKILEALQRKAINKIDNSFNILQEDKPIEQDNNINQ